MALRIETVQGKKFSADFAAALRDLLASLPFDVQITQGGFNGTNVSASAGTHAGDAVDFSVRGLNQAQVTQLIFQCRRRGIAAWFRTTSVAKWGTRAHGFANYHVHGVPNGWGAPSEAARRQIEYTDSRGVKRGYRNGRDGLASNQADLGPGHTSEFRNTTWANYIPSRPKPEPKPVQEEDIMATKEELAEIVRVQVNAALVDYTERQKRFIPQDNSGSGPVNLSHFIVQGHAHSVQANRGIAALAAQAGLDEKLIITAVVAGISNEIQATVAEMLGDVASEFADEFADAFAQNLIARLED